jgi:hypothetical protein
MLQTQQEKNIQFRLEKLHEKDILGNQYEVMMSERNRKITDERNKKMEEEQRIANRKKQELVDEKLNLLHKA